MTGKALGRIAACSLWLLLLGGCGTAKNSGTASAAPPPAGDAATVGLVTSAFADQGCPILIKVQQGDEVTYMIPIGLEERYRKEGLRLKFTYRASKASSGNCMRGSPAILENITVL